MNDPTKTLPGPCKGCLRGIKNGEAFTLIPLNVFHQLVSSEKEF